MVLIIYEPFCNADDECLSVPEELDPSEHVLEPRHAVLPSQEWVKLTSHLDSQDNLQLTDPLWFLEHFALQAESHVKILVLYLIRKDL